jgi:Flp pilus assembly protein TadB
MPSRKQRRRRAKERRHEYEIVYVDEEGHEVEAPPEEVERRAARDNGKPAAKPAPKGGAKKATKGGSVRAVPPPSWQRVAKRGAVFAPFMAVTLYLLGIRSWTVLVQTVWLLLLFIPFSYLVDRMMYRRYLRQTGQLRDEPRAKKS